MPGPTSNDQLHWLRTDCTLSLSCAVRSLIQPSFGMLCPTLEALANLISCRLHLRLSFCSSITLFFIATLDRLLRAFLSILRVPFLSEPALTDVSL